MANKKSDELQINYLNDSIKYTLRNAFVFVILSMAVYAWLVIWAIIFIVADGTNSILTLIYIWVYVSFLMEYLFFSGGNIFIICWLRKKEQINYVHDRIFYIIYLALSLFTTVLPSVFTFVYYMIDVAIAGTISISDGWVSVPLGIILGSLALFSFVSYINVAVSYNRVVKKYKIEYADDIRSYKEKQQKLAQQNAEKKQYEKDVSSLTYLLSKVGNKFFIKYYFQLRDWSELDIIDIIQEDYREETKQQRVRKAKEIFEKELNKLALQTIADVANNSVDEETRQKASKLLEQIK